MQYPAMPIKIGARIIIMAFNLPISVIHAVNNGGKHSFHNILIKQLGEEKKEGTSETEKMLQRFLF